MIKIELGAYIKKVRTDKKLSLRQTAKITGVSHPYLSQLETGSHNRPSIEILEKLAMGLGVPCNYLTYLAGYYRMPLIELDENLTDREKEEKIWKATHFTMDGFFYIPSKTLPPVPYDPQATEYNDDKNKVYETVAWAYEHNEPLPVIVDNENKVNIEVYNENGMSLSKQDTRELNALIQGFLYGKKFMSKKLEENVTEDTYKNEDK